jgi:LysR family transcriptional regulator, glycine cleavage system transcriptional activator
VQLLRGVLPLLQRLDTTVRQIRSARGRRHVSVATFASFASLWLLPRLRQFEAAHPDIDIRISATDAMVDFDDPEIDLLLRYCLPADAPEGAQLLFGEVITPVVSCAFANQARQGHAPRMAQPKDLAAHTLLEEDESLPSSEYLSWRRWLRDNGVAKLEPARWLYLNFTYQQIQAALAGGGAALGRIAMIGDSLARGDLVEPFGAERRMVSPFAYWLIDLAQHRGERSVRPEVSAFAQWLAEQASVTRQQMDGAVNATLS